MAKRRILIWLPSPMGDAIMAVPALRAIRRRYEKDHIIFIASQSNEQVLSPCPYCDEWLTQDSFFRNLEYIKAEHFHTAILLKNSFGSALTVRLAHIPQRIGYARDGRSPLLTDRIQPLRNPDGGFAPTSAIDYYLRIAEMLGVEAGDRRLALSFTDSDTNLLREKLPAVFSQSGPLVILVPGGAFGPSKCWPSDRFAKVADTLTDCYNAQMVISIAPTNREKYIAGEIQKRSACSLINLGDSPLPLGALKALFARADLVITNDTGPRHITAALGRNLISLFGPTNPEWTRTGYDKETQIVGRAPCVPCDKPTCKKNRHFCMESITVEEVLNAAKERLDGGRR